MMWLQSSAVSFKFFFQWITEESYRFPDTNPEKLLQREKWSSVWDHGVYIFFSSHCRILKFDISDSSSVYLKTDFDTKRRAAAENNLWGDP